MSEKQAAGRNPDLTARHQKRRNRIIWLTVAVALLFALGFAAWKWWSRPVVVTVVVSEASTEDVKVMNAFARRFGEGTRRGVILKVQTVPSSALAVDAFRQGRADLAVMRAGADISGEGYALATLRKAYGIVISLDPKVDSIAKLKGKRIGLVGPSSIHGMFINTLLQAYELQPGDVQRVVLDEPDAAKLVMTRSVDALVSVSPVATGRSADTLRAILKARGKIAMHFLPIDRAAEISRINPAFEEDDVTQGAFLGLPSEEIGTVSLATYVVAHADMTNEVAATLAREFLSNRSAVFGEAGAAAQISAPSLDKDAFMRVHPGAARYIGNEEETFSDKYGDLIYAALAIGSIIGSAIVGFRRSLAPDREADAYALSDQLTVLRRAARDAAGNVSLTPAAKRQVWNDASRDYEDLLTRTLMLIGDISVPEPTRQLLSTSLTATERAIAELAPIRS